MPGQNEHTMQAQHNRSFWSSFNLSTTPFIDWVVTGIFYEGIHWVEAFLSTRGEHPNTHGQRLLAMLRNNIEMAPIQADLEILKVESENARYRCYKHTSNEVSTEIIPLIDKIKCHTQSIFKKSSSAQP